MTPAISLRRYQPTDVDAVHEAVIESKAELAKWMAWCHADYSRKDVQTFVEKQSADWENKHQWNFLVVDATGRILGACGLHRLDLLNGVGEAGYWIRSSATGRGLATQATQLLCEWAFGEAGLHRVEILAAAENLASQRVARKAGAIREAILRERLLLHGRRHDCVLSAIIKK